jgi:two-component system, LuxR family, sensor kinase FixL
MLTSRTERDEKDRGRGESAQRFAVVLSRQVWAIVPVTLSIMIFAAAFFLLQRLTFLLRFPPFERTTIWAPGALLFAALLLTPPRRWWVYYAGLCLGALAAYQGDAAIPAWSALLAAQFHFGAVAIGAWGVCGYSRNPRFANPAVLPAGSDLAADGIVRESQFGNPAALLVFVIAAGLVVPLATTAPVDLVRWWQGANDVWPVALRSVLCVALGLLITTPALTLTLLNGRLWIRSLSWWRSVELMSVATLLLALGHIAFARPVDSTLPAVLYAPVPLLLWAALRFHLAGVCWALLALAYQSTWAAIHGYGPFTGREPADNVLQLQLFLFANALPLMFLAVVIEQRTRAFEALARQEQQVRSQYAQLRTIYQTAPVGLAFVDTQLRFVSANDRLAEMNGIPAAAHLGRTLRQVLPALADELEPVYQQAIQTGQPIVDAEVHGMTLARSDAERDWLVGHYPVKDPQGLILGVSTVVEEITERKRADQLRQELIHASRLALLGEFAASIAHEINQPLGAILSNADAAEMLLNATPPSLQEVRQIVADIQRDNLRASEVIRRLRNLFRKDEMNFEPLDLNEIVRETIAFVSGESRRRGINFQVELAERLPRIHGDKIYLQQVLINLFVNGMEAMADTVGAEQIVVRTISDGQEVLVSVTDTGPGIPDDRMLHVFDHYFSTKRAGMGLGLAITRSLVERHGGRIWAENAVGAGATFRFTLPAHVEPSTETPLAEKATVA